MAPNIKINKLIEDTDDLVLQPHEFKDLADSKDHEYKLEIVWRNVFLMAALHLSALYGMYLMFVSASWKTNLFAIFLYNLTGIGITAGAHRLWAHRSYKAKFPLRVLLMIMQTIAFQNDIYEWSRDHRVHHKYSETEADPHNANRGFFFSHVGWLLCRKHPDVKAKGALLDMSDLLKDPIVRFQKKYYLPMVLLLCFIMPTLLPNYLWGESIFNAFYICALWRYCWTLNMTWLVNSAAHMWGNKPYDNRISPTENIMTIMGAVGEGFHNFHHTFPWAYDASELGFKYNITTGFINFFAVIGQAYDLKVASKQMIKDRKIRTGDRPHDLEYKFFY